MSGAPIQPIGQNTEITVAPIIVAPITVAPIRPVIEKTKKKIKAYNLKYITDICEICCNRELIIPCNICNKKACKVCIRRYILDKESDVANCMYCKTVYTRATLVEMLGITFVVDVFSQHQSKARINKQKILLPTLQPIAEREINVENANKEIKRLNDLMIEQRQIIYQLSSSLYKQVEKKYIRPCAVADCNGFLNTNWKCGICTIETCKDCFEPITNTEIEHVCEAGAKETATLLKKDTKCCPKCGTGIYKIEGCFAKNTQILLWNNEIKMVQDIQVGDILIGDDGNERIVQDICNGEDELYEVIQNNGEKYIVNSKHTLVLKYSENEIEIIIDDYMKLSNNIKEELMGYNKDGLRTRILVKSIGKGEYYGFRVDKNNRFIMKDTTVVKNCDQMWCVCCNTAFSWKTGEIETGRIHNPHYYQHLRNMAGGGDIRREEGDLPAECHCIERINNTFARRGYAITAFIDKYDKFITSDKCKKEIKKIVLAFADLVRYYFHIDEILRNTREKIRDFDRIIQTESVRFLRNLTEKNIFEETISKYEKKKEIINERALLLTTLVNIVNDNIVKLFNDSINVIYITIEAKTSRPQPQPQQVAAMTRSKEKDKEFIDDVFCELLEDYSKTLRENYTKCYREIKSIIEYCISEDDKLGTVYKTSTRLDIYVNHHYNINI